MIFKVWSRVRECKELTRDKSSHVASNDNTKRVIEFAFENNMEITSATFGHKNIG